MNRKQNKSNKLELLEKLISIEDMRIEAHIRATFNVLDSIEYPDREEHYKRRAEIMFAIADRLDKYFNKLKTQL